MISMWSVFFTSITVGYPECAYSCVRLHTQALQVHFNVTLHKSTGCKAKAEQGKNELCTLWSIVRR